MATYGTRTVCDTRQADYRPAFKDAGVQAVLPVFGDMAFGQRAYQRLDMVCGSGDGVVRDCGA